MFCKRCGKDMVGINKCLYCGYLIDESNINDVSQWDKKNEVIANQTTSCSSKVTNVLNTKVQHDVANFEYNEGSVDVVIIDSGTKKNEAIRVIRMITKLGLIEARNVLDGIEILKDISFETARMLIEKLETIGVQAQIM